MKLTFIHPLAKPRTKKNTCTNISNLPTQFLMQCYVNKWVWKLHENLNIPFRKDLNKRTLSAIRQTLRLRSIKRGSLKAVL